MTAHSLGLLSVNRYGVLLLPRGPVGQNRANADERHPNFRFEIRQEVGNPPGRVGVPINQRWSTGREISVNPEGHARTRKAPSQDCCFAHERSPIGEFRSAKEAGVTLPDHARESRRKGRRLVNETY